MKHTKATINYGIQATSVSAKAIAVGERATASNTETGCSAEERDAITKILEKLRVEVLKQPNAGATEVATRIEDLRSDVAQNKVDKSKLGDQAKGIVEALKAVGVVVPAVVALKEPLNELAELLSVPLSFLFT